MEQYISKDALVAEIERLIERAEAERVLYPKTILAAKNYLLIEDYKKLLSKIDNLEVKEEVDFKEEIKEVQRHYKTIEEYEGYPCTMYANNIEWIAKHFFELGMSVSNKVQKG